MAKKRSPQKPDPKQEPSELPVPAHAPPENVKIGPLDPPPPESGEGTTTGDESSRT